MSVWFLHSTSLVASEPQVPGATLACSQAADFLPGFCCALVETGLSPLNTSFSVSLQKPGNAVLLEFFKHLSALWHIVISTKTFFSSFIHCLLHPPPQVPFCCVAAETLAQQRYLLFLQLLSTALPICPCLPMEACQLIILSGGGQGWALASTRHAGIPLCASTPEHNSNTNISTKWYLK